MVLTTAVSLFASVGTGVDAVGLAERPRDEPVDVLTTDVAGVLSSLGISFDGVDARESLSLPFELVPSSFFGLGTATAAETKGHLGRKHVVNIVLSNGFLDLIESKNQQTRIHQ